MLALSQINPIHTLKPSCFKIHNKITLSTKFLIYLYVFRSQFCATEWSFPQTCYRSRPSRIDFARFLPFLSPNIFPYQPVLEHVESIFVS